MSGRPASGWRAGLSALIVAIGPSHGAAAAAAPELPRVAAEEPRAFGYRVGDTVSRQVVVQVPAGWRLDERSLPRRGRAGPALEVRQIGLSTQADGSGVRHTLSLQYQIFAAPTAVRVYDIPSFRLRLNGPGRDEDLLVEAWPLTVAPLTPVAAPQRRGLGELQADRPPPRVDTAPLQSRLSAWGLIAVLLLSVLAADRLGERWLFAHRRPFAQVWRQLRHLPESPPTPVWRAACRQVHQALNRSAGEAVFETTLQRFVDSQPRYHALRDDIAWFLGRSRREFFAGSAPEPDDAQTLRRLVRRLRDAERDAA
jgi:mxaA protein